MTGILTDQSPPGVLWTRTNAVEAAPGVLTPLTWSYYGAATESGCRRSFSGLGIIPARETAVPAAVGDRLFGIFHGRYTINVDVIRHLMSGFPGVSGDDVERDLLGQVRPGVPPNRHGLQGAVVLGRMPVALWVHRRAATEVRDTTRAWWERRVLGEITDPRGLLRESLARFDAVVLAQARTRILFGGASSQVAALAERAGDPAAAGSLLSGAAGLEEAAVAADLARLARGELALDAFLARHGFHGPNGGDPAATAWREDPAPLERLLDAVARAEPPAERQARAAAEAARVRERILAALPAHQRPGARGLLRLAPATARGLEQTKTAFLMAIDGGRAAVRAIGAELVAAGELDDPEDAFLLRAHELLNLNNGARYLCSDRRREREACLAVELPETWTGQPVPVPAGGAHERVTRIEGLGVSPGVVEGRVRIVLDPGDDVDVEPGEVLVCPTTDPSWVGLMTVAAALVIDIGAAASHGAIVARELGVPCVIGVRHGTTGLRDGDRVRVDGAAGTVDVLSA